MQMLIKGEMIFSLKPAILLQLIIMFLVVMLSAQPARADGGTYLGTTTLLQSGDPAQKIDIVFLGDGFTDAQQGDFNSRVDAAVAEFLRAHPLQALRSAFNIYRVNVASPESGTDKYSVCNGTSTGYPDQTRQTAMDTGYCSAGTGTVNRCVWSSNTFLARDFANNAPDVDQIYVLVNDTGWGGCAGGDLAYGTVANDYETIVIHEFGHSLFGLADEYDYDGADHYTGVEPFAPNATIATDRTTLKWADLVSTSTSVPTRRKTDCSSRGGSVNAPIDQVGTYEGAIYNGCDVFRPHPTSRMRESNKPFNVVNQQQIIRRLRQIVGSDSRSVTFDNLLIRNDHDGWLRGKGDIYFRYSLRSNAEEVNGRWPASGESKFDDNQSKNINVFAGMIPAPAAGTSAAIDLKVRDADWPDSDDVIRSDVTGIPLPNLGPFTVDRSEYRLQGDVSAPTHRVLLDFIHIKDDHDGAFRGAGDIRVSYTISNGRDQINGRWPSSGTVDINSGKSKEIAKLAGTIAQPTGTDNLSVRFRVVDDDWPFSDDLICDETFSFNQAQNYGADDAVFVRDTGDCRITFSIVGL